MQWWSNLRCAAEEIWYFGKRDRADPVHAPRVAVSPLPSYSLLNVTLPQIPFHRRLFTTPTLTIKFDGFGYPQEPFLRVVNRDGFLNCMGRVLRRAIPSVSEVVLWQWPDLLQPSQEIVSAPPSSLSPPFFYTLSKWSCGERTISTPSAQHSRILLAALVINDCLLVF